MRYARRVRTATPDAIAAPDVPMALTADEVSPPLSGYFDAVTAVDGGGETRVETCGWLVSASTVLAAG